ncbi:MAG: hypothetical protein JXQ99_27280 [Hyphomicrobiaceae bacterium]
MRRIHAPTLIELSIASLKSEIQTQKSLNGEQRYALAMAINALSIARNEIIGEPDAAQWQLLDHIYDDGEGTMKQLARDIRTKAVNETTHPDLRQRLETLLVAELEVRNPAALRRRAAANDQ